MQRIETNLSRWTVRPATAQTPLSPGWFAAIVLSSALVSAALSSWLPLQMSIASVFLFAGPHNWFEARYFLMRLPVRFGRSRNFFIVAFAGIGLLSCAYVSLPALYYWNVWSGANWTNAIAIWNTAMVLWIAALVVLRSRQKTNRDWFWIIPMAFASCGLNWLSPDLFSLAIVYAHPLIALWFLDRHLRRTKPEWLTAYRRCLMLLPPLVLGMLWQLSRMAPLNDDNGLFWRITQHAGAELLPNVSSHMLVSMHVFLEMLHYGVWIFALPLIGATGAIWNVRSIPVANHSCGFPKVIGAMLVFGLIVVIVLFVGFSTNYTMTRDIYFTIAMAHVLAEAPFLLRMI
ncbi:MAG TPA: hypothetical protein VE863_04225 [Pyrinomonadaceae bacterium]|jgi:hypothetical protein|nr:hypothetical protein [Pyrinomonadaceae bacterium]